MPPLDEIKKTAMINLSKLPEKHKKLKNAAEYSVEISPELRKLTLNLNKKLKRKL
ncbi:hypothetical protein HYX03_03655 [Candidatus Woesearchaeota archaeon]|nr:hypothetical protein [Candidatus Woesearchaeota archaeon]